MNRLALINNIRMASKSQLVDEIRSKDQKIKSLTDINHEINKQLNHYMVIRNNFEKEVQRLKAVNGELKKKYWFEFWR